MVRKRRDQSARLIGPGSQGRVPRGPLLGLALLLVAASGTWMGLGLRQGEPTFVSTLAVPARAVDAIEPAPPIPSADLETVALWTDLFPEPKVPPPADPPKPPRLGVELRALINPTQSGGYAFVFDPAQQLYLRLQVGDEVPGGAVLAALDENSATFDVGGRTVRRMLDR